MDNIDKEIVVMQRDISHAGNKIEELRNDFKTREPAKETNNFITEIKVIMKGQTDELKNLTKTLDAHVSDQKIHDVKVELQLEATQKTITEFINSADEKYANSEQLRFLRNLLIAGILVTTLTGIIALILNKILG